MLDALKRNGTIRTVSTLAVSAWLSLAAAGSRSLRPPLPGSRRPDDWVGKAVVAQGPRLRLNDAQRGSPVKGPAEVYHVRQVNGTRSFCPARASRAGRRATRSSRSTRRTSSSRNRSGPSPAESFPHTMRAIVALAHQGDLDRAIGDLSEAIRLAPSDADALPGARRGLASEGRARQGPRRLRNRPAARPAIRSARRSSERRSGPIAGLRQGNRRLQRSDSPRSRRSSRPTSAERPPRAKRRDRQGDRRPGHGHSTESAASRSLPGARGRLEAQGRNRQGHSPT